MSENKYLIYVDGISGNDTNSGEVLSPVKTLQHAYDIATNGSLIVLQANASSYGDLIITKNISLMSAHGIRAEVGQLTVQNAQVFTSFLDCVSTTGTGISINNSGIDKTGCLQVNNCNFGNINFPIILNNCNYASIHRNKFQTYSQAVQINGCSEITASANTFYDGPQAFVVLNTGYLDIYNNTLFGKLSIPPVGETNINLRVIYVTISNSILSSKYIDLPSYAAANESGYNVAVNTVNGTSFDYGTDYTVNNGGRTVSWNGLNLVQELHAGDILRIMYSDAETTNTGEIIYAIAGNPKSRIDSNNINDGLIGVHFIGDLRIRYNNFFGTYTGIIGVSSDYTGNINIDPNYVNKPLQNFELNPNSPDIYAADPYRSGQILQELGVGITGGGFTGIFAVEREGVAPFDRNIDKDGRHRFTLKNRDDIGAYEYPDTGINADPYTYIFEDGYDINVPGSYTGPYGTLDRGFQDPKDIIVNTNILMYEGYTGPLDQGATGIQYGRYSSDDLNLSSDQLLIGKENKSSVIYIYPSYPSCGITGLFVGPTPPADEMSGDTGSITNPFSDIKDAINAYGSSTGVIFVYPSFYSSFKGSPGIEIVGLPKINNINLDKMIYNTYAAVGWTGANFAVFDDEYISFNGSDDIASLFQMLNSFSIRFDMQVIMDKLETKVFNDSNFVSVSKSGSTLTFKYYTGGMTYTANAVSTDNSYRLFIDVKDDKAVVRVKGFSTDIERDINFVSGYTGPWSMDYIYTYNSLPGWTGIVTNFLIESDKIYMPDLSIIGYTGTATERKVYGIVGETGLNDWYEANI
jgi:hypothetical protein